MFGEVFPSPPWFIHGYALEAAGAGVKAIAEYKRSLEIAVFPDAYASLGHAFGIEGDTQAAMSWLAQLRQFKEISYVSEYYEALVHVSVGQVREALDALDRAYLQKCDWLIYLKVESRWEPLRSETRFLELLGKVGLLSGNET